MTPTENAGDAISDDVLMIFKDDFNKTKFYSTQLCTTQLKSGSCNVLYVI